MYLLWLFQHITQNEFTSSALFVCIVGLFTFWNASSSFLRFICSCTNLRFCLFCLRRFGIFRYCNVALIFIWYRDNYYLRLNATKDEQMFQTYSRQVPFQSISLPVGRSVFAWTSALPSLCQKHHGMWGRKGTLGGAGGRADTPKGSQDCCAVLMEALTSATLSSCSSIVLTGICRSHLTHPHDMVVHLLFCMAYSIIAIVEPQEATNMAKAL